MPFGMLRHVVSQKLTGVSQILERRSDSIRLQKATRQKPVSFTLSTMRTWNLAKNYVFETSYFHNLKWSQTSPKKICIKFNNCFALQFRFNLV